MVSDFPSTMAVAVLTTGAGVGAGAGVVAAVPPVVPVPPQAAVATTPITANPCAKLRNLMPGNTGPGNG